MLLIALAAQLSAPAPINFFDWWRDEFPISVYKAGITRVLLTRTTVRPDGSIQGCEVERGSGNAELDAVTCVIVRKKGKFRPAKASDGSATFGVFRQEVTWAPYADDPKLHRPDTEVTVDQLPRGLHAPATVRLAVAVDEQGRLSSCEGEPAPGISDRAQRLAGIACEQLIRSYTAIPAKDDYGRAVRSIQDLTVEVLNSKP